MPTTYLLLCNSGLARIWRSKSHLLNFREIARIEKEQSFEYERFEPPSVESEDPEMDLELFAEELTERLAREYQDGTFDDLVLVAESTFLQRLKAKLPRRLRRILIETIPEDLCDQSEFEIKRTLKLHFASPSFTNVAFR